ncbi:MAG: SDR family oxidoreductase [Actinoplanes sp.]
MPTALITGGTTGIGRTTAELLLTGGYQVAITGRNPESLARARAELPDDALVARSESGDLEDTDALIATVRERFGSLDLLFLNAGVFRPSPITEVTEQDFDRQVTINFKGTFFTLQKALPIMNDGGSVVMTVGLGAHRGSPGSTVGAATRGALLTMLPSLALELAPRRIRINSVSPGLTRTPLLDKLGVPATAIEAMRQAIPLGRVGSGQEVAEAVAFLGSDAAAYITGQDLVVAGGRGLGI